MDPSHPHSSSPAGGFGAIDPKIRNLAIGLFVLALLVLIGIFTSSWATASERGGSAGVGLTGLEACFRDTCKTISWSDSKAPFDFTLFGYLGILGGLAAAAGAVAMGVFAMTNKPNKVPANIFNIVLGVSAGAMLLFFIRVMTHKELKGLSISYSGILAIGGVVGIFVVSKMLREARGS